MRQAAATNNQSGAAVDLSVIARVPGLTPGMIHGVHHALL